MNPRTTVFFVIAAFAAAGATAGERALAEVLEGHDATFVAVSEATGLRVVHDPERAARRVSPCSTFKIPNAAIALETGIATGPDHVRAFDSDRRPRRPGDSDRRWAVVARDHDLASAIRNSVVWYFQEVAVEIGETRMAEALRRFDYGNRDLSGGIDRFWLSSSLRISADGQVAFLRRLAAGELASERTTRALAAMLRQDDAPEGVTIHAKTGTGRTPEGRALGWWVGWVERPDDRVVFAFRMEADDFGPIWRQRIDLARAALVAIGALPAKDAR